MAWSSIKQVCCHPQLLAHGMHQPTTIPPSCGMLAISRACYIMTIRLPFALLQHRHLQEYVCWLQATLLALLQRLAIDHPHHTLYQLFALKNGNRGKDGKAVQAGDVVGGMSVTVAYDKVQAAHDLLRVVASNPAR